MALPDQPAVAPQLPSPRLTAGRFVSGITIGTLSFAVAGALASALGAWAWALGADNAETNSEAAEWFLVGAAAGAILLAPVGAVVGLLQRVTNWSMRPSWLFPLAGAALGLLLASSGQHSHITWPILGLGGGLIVAVLTRAFLATT